MIAIGCDHGGFVLKKEIMEYLEERGIKYKDFGCDSEESCDYPVYAQKVAGSIVQQECTKGILICGTGVGVSIAANKVDGIRAALCHDSFTAKATREHNDSNVLALGARVIGSGLALEIVDLFLNTDFSEEERHRRRIAQLEEPLSIDV